jgi:hypothetical protein
MKIKLSDKVVVQFKFEPQILLLHKSIKFYRRKDQNSCKEYIKEDYFLE